jgi:multidrug efflux pump subunit AcrA (membrane-fusion protein)
LQAINDKKVGKKSGESVEMENQEVLAQEVTAQPQQASLTQDQVNRIVAREKQAAAEKARREAEAKYQADLEALRMQQQERNSHVSREADANEIYQQVQERFNREMQERQLKDQMSMVANNYLYRIEEGKKNYQDFSEVTKDFDPVAFPQITFLLSGMENAGDVLYDLSKNPTKLAAIDQLAQRSQKLAQSELLKLSKSISDNKQSLAEAQAQLTPDPLDRISPSRVAGSNGKMTIKDLRNQPWLRG